MRPGFQEIILIILIGLLVWAGFRFFNRNKNKGEEKTPAKKATKATSKKKKQGG